MYIYKSGHSSFSSEEVPVFEKDRAVSVILPTYNEEGSIFRLIGAISQQLSKYDFEIVVVDDDSKDSTPEIIDEYSKSGRVAAIHRKGRRGIFSAIQDGIKASKGKIIVIMDADFSHPPEKIPELLSHVGEYDIVIGSRFLPESRIQAPFLRRLTTNILNLVVRTLLGLKIRDTTGGFHAIKREKFEEIEFRYPSTFGEFDMELLYIAAKRGFSIKEIPFSYSFRQEGVSKSSDSLVKFVWYGFRYNLRALQLRLFR